MARRSGSWPSRTGGSCRCTATGCSDPSPTPRTPSRRRCWPPGKASAGSLKNAPHCAPGCTRSPPTGAPTRAAQRAGARPGSGTCLSTNRSCRPRATRPSGLRRFRSPPRQVAVLILRDVLGFHASEVAGMLEVTLESANSTLKRARASLQRRQQPAAGHQPPPAAGSPAEDAIVAKFARAWESADLDALVALLTDDVFIAMPPEPFGYEGRELVARYCARQFGAGRRFDLVPTRANGQPAFGAYLRGPAGISHATGFYVLTLASDQICGMTRFEASVLPWFGLPRSLPAR